MIRISILLFGLFLLTSCKDDDKIPSGILKPEKMQAVLWDVIRAEAFTNQFIKSDSAKNAEEENLKLQQKVFAVHKVSKETFYKSYDYYKSKTSGFKAILDRMVSQVERDKKKPLMPE